MTAEENNRAAQGTDGIVSNLQEIEMKSSVSISRSNDILKHAAT
jgi:hypothetical protein